MKYVSDLYPIIEAHDLMCRRLGVKTSIHSFRRSIKAGKIPSTVVGGRVLVPMDAYCQIIEEALARCIENESVA